MQRSSFGGRGDAYAAITARIVAAMEAGAGEFIMPWHRSGVGIGRPKNARSGRRYQGGNVVALWAEEQLAGFSSGYWATYRQWQELGAQVRRGEHGASVVFFKTVEADGEEEDEPRRRFYARTSRVFAAEQVEGWQAPEEKRPDLVQTVAAVEDLVQHSGAVIEHGGDLACFDRDRDVIRMPERSRFHGSPTSTPTESYYATQLHELVHWTGAEHRLDRQFGRFGDETYAFEELVAELGAAFLCADLGVSNEPRADHAAYLASWIKGLTDDPSALFRASRLATSATAILLGPDR